MDKRGPKLKTQNANKKKKKKGEQKPTGSSMEKNDENIYSLSITEISSVHPGARTTELATTLMATVELPCARAFCYIGSNARSSCCSTTAMSLWKLSTRGWITIWRLVYTPSSPSNKPCIIANPPTLSLLPVGGKVVFE